MPLRYDFMLYRQKGILFPVMFPTTLKQNMFVRDQAYVVSTIVMFAVRYGVMYCKVVRCNMAERALCPLFTRKLSKVCSFFEGIFYRGHRNSR